MYELQAPPQQTSNEIVLSEGVERIKHHYGDAVKALLVYGSRVNGYEKPTSDLDCLIVLNEGYDDMAGMDEFSVRGIEVHADAVTEERFLKDLYNDQKMRNANICTTLYAYEAPIGKEYIERVDSDHKYKVVSDILDEVAYAAGRIDVDDPVYLSMNDVVEGIMTERLIALPEMGERVERMINGYRYDEVLSRVQASYRDSFDRLEQDGVLSRTEGCDDENPVYEYLGERGGSWFHSFFAKNLGRMLTTPFLNKAASVGRTSSYLKKGHVRDVIKSAQLYAVSLVADYIDNYRIIASHKDVLAPREDGGYQYQCVRLDDLLDMSEGMKSRRQEREALKSIIIGG